MRRGWRWVVAVFSILYVAALALFAIGHLGLFGHERDPLAGVFLVPLGWPWNRAVDLAPEPLWPWLAAVAPALNLALLAGVGRFAAALRERTRQGAPLARTRRES